MAFESMLVGLVVNSLFVGALNFSVRFAVAISPGSGGDRRISINQAPVEPTR